MRYDPTVFQPSKDIQPRHAGAPHVLVVDDDPLVRATIEVCLERHNFRVTVADAGESGLCVLEAFAFDLMIVNIFMPGMRGFESIRIFHERAPAVPLLAMSGYAFANVSSPLRATPTAHPGPRCTTYGAKSESTQRDAESAGPPRGWAVAAAA